MILLSHVKRAAEIVSAVAWLSGGTAVAQSWPAPGKPLRIVVPAGPGSAADVRSRQLAHKLTESLGVAVLVENRAGADGLIGAQEAARAAPDGHTLFMGSINTHVINDLIDPGRPFRADRVLVPVTRVASGIAILVASPAFGVRTLQDVLARARARPGAVRYAASGALGRLLGEMIKDAVQIDMLEIPYKTQSQELTQLMSGQVDLSVTFISVVQSHLQSGKLVPIAVASSRRHGGVPDVPTFGEAGVPGVEATGWIGFFVPIKTPERIIMSVHREVRRALETDDIREDYVGAGLDIGGEPPEAFAAFIRTRPSVGANSSGSAISS